MRFYWLGLKMKNKKMMGYVDFLKNKKARKIYEKIFSNYELVFPTSYVFYICIKFQLREYL